MRPSYRVTVIITLSLAEAPLLSVTVSLKTSAVGSGEMVRGMENEALAEDALESVTGYPDTCCH